MNGERSLRKVARRCSNGAQILPLRAGKGTVFAGEGERKGCSSRERRVGGSQRPLGKDKGRQKRGQATSSGLCGVGQCVTTGQSSLRQRAKVRARERQRHGQREGERREGSREGLQEVHLAQGGGIAFLSAELMFRGMFHAHILMFPSPWQHEGVPFSPTPPHSWLYPSLQFQ